MTLQDISENLGKLIANLTPHIVRIRTQRRTATGFTLEPGRIVTAAHTLRKGGDIAVVTDGGEEKPARLAGRDFRYDLALLEVSDTPDPPPFADAADVTVGHLVFPLGRPGRSLRAAFGMVSVVAAGHRLPGGGELSTYIETDGNLPGGFSGGPLMDAAGRILGMNTSVPRGMGMTVPVDDLKASAARIGESGDLRRGYLGINTVPVPLTEGGEEGQLPGVGHEE